MNSKDEISPQLREIEKDEARALATSYFHPVVWAQIKGMAETFIVSKALPSHIQNTAQAVMVLQAGYEMGMKPIEAINSVYIVNGAVNVWGKATIRRIREHGYFIEYLEDTDEKCTAKVYKPETKEEYVETFYFADAEASGWTKDRSGNLKVGWRKGQNRKLKMRYGVLSAIIKSYIPDVLGSAVDIAEIAEDVEIIDVRKDAESSEIKVAGESTSLREHLAKTQEEPEEGEVIGETEEPKEKKEEARQDEVKDSTENKAALRKSQKEFFAIAKELGIESEEAKENIKLYFQAKSFNDISLEELRGWIKAARAKIAAQRIA